MNWRSAVMVAVLLPMILCGFAMILRRVERRASVYLGIALILTAMTMGPQVIGFADGYDLWPWLTFFPFFYVDLWIGPLLYLHAFTLVKTQPLGWRKWLFLPGVLQFLYYSGAFILPGVFDHEAKWAFSKSVHNPYIIPIESILGASLLLGALIAIWRLRRVYLGYLERTESAVRDYDPIWLRNLGVALTFGVLVFVALESADLLVGLSYITAFPFQLLLMAIVTWLALDASWRLTSAFPKMRTDPVKLEMEMSEADSLAKTIETRMLDSEWFLEPRLSVGDVAKRLGTNESYVSRAVNSGLGKSFNRYVNEMRVAYAKEQMREEGTQILTIALNSGFNSKATFNRVFREFEGVTPSQFRKSQNP